MTAARGERLNNPLNIKHSSANWKGRLNEQPDSIFVAFESPAMGIRAAAKNLLTYYKRDRLTTIRRIVAKWAPPTDGNDTESYIGMVATEMGVDANAPLNLDQREVMADLVTAMMRVEIGRVPYDAGTIFTAVAMAYGADPAPSQVVEVKSVNQPTAAPTRKVTAFVGGGGVGFVLAFMVTAMWNRVMPEAILPEEAMLTLGSAFSLGLGFVSAWLTREKTVIVKSSEDKEIPA